MQKDIPESWLNNPFDSEAAFADTGPGHYDDPSSVKVFTNPEPIPLIAAKGGMDEPRATSRLDTPEAAEHHALEKAVDEGTIALRHLDLFLRWLGRYENAAPAEYQQLADDLADAVERYEKRLDKQSGVR